MEILWWFEAWVGHLTHKDCFSIRIFIIRFEEGLTDFCGKVFHMFTQCRILKSPLNVILVIRKHWSEKSIKMLWSTHTNMNMQTDDDNERRVVIHSLWSIFRRALFSLQLEFWLHGETSGWRKTQQNCFMKLNNARFGVLHNDEWKMGAEVLSVFRLPDAFHHWTLFLATLASCRFRW